MGNCTYLGDVAGKIIDELIAAQEKRAQESQKCIEWYQREYDFAMTDSNLEPRVEAVEIDMQELKRSISDLKSTVSTLADIVGVHEQQHQESMQRHEDSLRRHEESMRRHEESMRRHEDSLRRHEESERRADADRALMLQLIQAIAQGRNGGE